MTAEYKYLFGPVASRRLGKSLGIDLLPLKVCTFNCVYCEVGRTSNLTLERKEYVPTDQVLKELDSYLDNKPDLDFITFSGSGEPTMHSGIGKIIDHIKNNYPQYRVALLTNSSLLSDPEVIKDIKKTDLIVPSLDAASNLTFKKIDRAHKDLTLDQIIEGLISLRENYQGQIWLEIFIIEGLNDTDQELQLFKEHISRIKPDKIQLNSLDRPAPEEWVKPVAKERLKEIAAFFGEDVEVFTS